MTSCENTPFILYGLSPKVCDTIKKAQKYLQNHQTDYRFHDYRADGLEADLLKSFINQLGWEALLNTRGTTWRKLDEDVRNKVNNAATAAELMLEYPALIKRPLLRGSDGSMLIGFKESTYQSFIAEKS
ncbi:ArsC family reductase [Erwinia tracheiphila]|uniref:Reductase n=1 Tax=Erwinia tracheiphila TaxID=65700 RepID=A0A0M2KDU3_9GAMM|nr:ArsC family reductase [Erwinia tracheiphila]AXF76432.1 ArsC family reductase [Erwinia tracheiphila]EOS96269.1 reductase [Erwinia tracheiphila PSU-1]KKF35176.1 reductase [Erwinia tracheiphila]UIA84904.1 ArsC family reductase [Erwinia tracheiphila]UIA86827.1 ArsC family reductase [Erwinia tracheiphila]